MSFDLPLEGMTLPEKLAAMELLWADISRASDQLPSPAWHADILAQRRERVEQGELKFLDWETAFTDLRNELRGNSTA